MSPKTTLKQETLSIYTKLQSPDAEEVKGLWANICSW